MKRFEKQKKYMAVLVVAAMSAQLLCGCQNAGSVAEAKEAASGENKNTEAETIKDVPLSTADQGKLSKEETVYVIADASGNKQKLIVSDWVKNALGSAEITDKTELSDIENVKGEESFTKKDGDVGVWDAAGNDIYYRGSIEKEVPVDVKVSYQLDGKTIAPDQLAGKSGKVVIRFDYTNRQKQEVTIGEDEKQRTREMYIPFAVLSGTVLDNEKFSNVEVENGDVVNDGERTVVVGMAFPGMKENLELTGKDLDFDIPEYVQVTADVKDFELMTTLSVATCQPFTEMDLDDNKDLNDLQDDMDKLEDAMNQLLDGSQELYDGTVELSDGVKTLTDGIDELNKGAGDLRDGAGQLKDGTSELKKKVNELSSGMVELSSKSDDLNDGAKQVYESILGTVNEKLQALAPIYQQLGKSVPTLTIKDWETQIAGIQTDLDGLMTAVNAKKTELEGQKAQVEAGIASATDGKSQLVSKKAELEGTKTALEQQIAAAEDEETRAQLQGQLDAVNAGIGEVDTQLSGVEATLTDLNGKLAQINGGLDTVNENLQPLATAKGAVDMAKGSLSSYKQFYDGLKTYTGYVDQISGKVSKDLVSGVGKLDSGAGDLKDGTSKLKNGTSELKDGGKELKDGVDKLKDGCLELKDGIVKFNDEGIQKLIDTMNDDLLGTLDDLKGTIDAAKSYRSFAGIADNMDGNVKFIYKTAAIEMDDAE